LFDADGVVQHSSVSDLPTRLERILGFVPSNLDTFTREVFELERPALLGRVDLAKALVPLVARWGAPKAAGKLASEWWCSIDVDVGVLDLIGKLKLQGILCALGTNQQSYRAKYMDETLSYRTIFDRCFYSYRLGIVKPDIGFFQAVVANLGVAPEEVLFIDDTEINVASARGVGLQAVRLVRAPTIHSTTAMSALLARFAIVVD
jgi:putative hydrolase of the HAD superfamily